MLSIDALVTRVADLAPLPAAYLRLRELADDERVAAADIAAVIGHEPALTARILRMANSAYFSSAGAVDTIDRAVQILGLQRVLVLALATSATAALGRLQCERFDLYDFWRHSVHAAVLCQGLARELRRRDDGKLFVCGLLHNVGHLILAAEAPGALDFVLAEAETTRQDLYIVEQRHLGFDSAQLGSALLRFWQLPETICSVVAQQREPLADTGTETAVRAGLVHIASRLGSAILRSEAPDLVDEPPEVERWALVLTGLDQARLADAAAAAATQVADVMDLVVPGEMMVYRPVGAEVRRRLPA